MFIRCYFVMTVVQVVLDVSVPVTAAAAAAVDGIRDSGASRAQSSGALPLKATRIWSKKVRRRYRHA